MEEYNSNTVKDLAKRIRDEDGYLPGNCIFNYSLFLFSWALLTLFIRVYMDQLSSTGNVYQKGLTILYIYKFKCKII